MSSGKRVVKNTGVLMFMEFGVRLLDALVAIVLARYLAPEGFGLLAFAISFSWIFSILPGFGMGSLMTRDLARDRSQLSRYLSNGLAAKFFLAVLTVILMEAVSWILGYSPDKQGMVFLAGLLMIFETNVRYTLSFFQAVQRMNTVAWLNIAVRAGWLIGSLTVVLLKGGIFPLLIVRVAVTALGLIASIVLVDRKLERIRWTFEPSFIGQILKASIPFAIFRLYGQVYTDIDTVMLSTLRGDLMTGWYSAAYKVLRFFTFIPPSFFGATLPAMSKSSDSRQNLAKTIASSSKFLTMIALPIFGGTFVVADQIILMLYGHAYDGSIPALRIMSWSILFAFLNSVLLAAVAAVDKEWKGGTYLMMGAAFSTLSNLIVIPLFGHLGAAGTTFMAEVFIFTLQLRLLKTALPELKLFPGVVKNFVSVGVMMGITWLIRGAGLFVTIPAAALVYIGCLIVLKAVGPEEWRLLVKLILRKVASREEIRARFGIATSKTGITVHCRVLNEERFVRAAILSVLPIADHVLVFDTGSTDRTLEEIASIQNSKIEIVRRPPADARGIMEYRNEMIGETRTEWFLQVDGDEIYPEHAVERIKNEIQKVPGHVHRIVVDRRHFIKNFNFLSPPDRLGRIYRTKEVRWKMYDPLINKVGHETPYLVKRPDAPLREFSMNFPGDIFFFHAHHLERSSKDRELGVLRHWRRFPFPAVPYFGPWPETLKENGRKVRRTPEFLTDCLALNLQILGQGVLEGEKRIRRRLERIRENKSDAERDHEPG